MHPRRERRWSTRPTATIKKFPAGATVARSRLPKTSNLLPFLARVFSKHANEKGVRGLRQGVSRRAASPRCPSPGSALMGADFGARGAPSGGRQAGAPRPPKHAEKRRKRFKTEKIEILSKIFPHGRPRRSLPVTGRLLGRRSPVALPLTGSTRSAPPARRLRGEPTRRPFDSSRGTVLTRQTT